MSLIHTWTERVTKRAWYDAGGTSNPRCWRKHNGRSWEYYIERCNR